MKPDKKIVFFEQFVILQKNMFPLFLLLHYPVYAYQPICYRVKSRHMAEAGGGGGGGQGGPGPQ